MNNPKLNEAQINLVLLALDPRATELIKPYITHINQVNADLLAALKEIVKASEQCGTIAFEYIVKRARAAAATNGVSEPPAALQDDEDIATVTPGERSE